MTAGWPVNEVPADSENFILALLNRLVLGPTAKLADLEVRRNILQIEPAPPTYNNDPSKRGLSLQLLTPVA